MNESVIIEKYGRELYDLTETILHDRYKSHMVVRKVIVRVLQKAKKERYSQFERAWIFRILVEEIQKNLDDHYDPHFSKMKNIPPEKRLESVIEYLDSIPKLDRFLFILHDKFHFQYDEIAAILGTPIDSLRLRRMQILRRLEDKIWN